MKPAPTEAIQRIAKRIGRYITREENRFIKGRWPKAMPEEQIEALVAQFNFAAKSQSNLKPSRACVPWEELDALYRVAR